MCILRFYQILYERHVICCGAHTVTTIILQVRRILFDERKN